MKAVLPVAGAGVQLRPLTYTQPKPLLPVAGKPIISFAMEQLLGAGIRDFVFIIGYLGEKIKNFLENNYPDVKMQFVQQEERLGAAHAIYTAHDVIDPEDEIIVFFGDVIIDKDVKEFVDHPESCLGVKRVATPWEFGIVEFDEQGRVVKLVEKPRIPKSDMAMVGVYKIKQAGSLLKAIEYRLKHKLATNKEYPITDSLMQMLEWGARFDTIQVNNWYDCGKKEVLLETNAIFLEREGYAYRDPGIFDNSIIIHPVSIGPNCVITNSIIGPHVTIGANTKIDHSVVKNSIIGNYASLREVILMKSIIGNDTSVTGLRHSLNIGDNTEIDFN